MARAAQGQAVNPIKMHSVQYAPDFKIGRHNQQHRKGGNDQDNVGEDVEDFIHQAAAIAGGETHQDADEGSHAAAENADQEGCPQA